MSRILDGVIGNLANDTQKRRRFVWDEMYFLEWWWTNRATALQQETMKQLVSEGRIEFVDNGWSQADMGCTTYDSLLNNWVEGHQWIKRVFGAQFAPHVGWSLDPFGMSTGAAVLQSLMGFDAWFFTRVPDSRVVEGKKDKSLEFVWRASSSLPDAQTEIFAHIFESYYCMPLPDFAFELGPEKGAPPCSASNAEQLARKLVEKTLNRAEWFRTNNVLIPWGCDYQYQNAVVNYESTDCVIDAINKNAEAWGVTAEYCTATEYLKAIQQANVALPVKDDGQTFFPYNSWSGYFTSRPRLKSISQQSHGPLHAAEGLFALRTPTDPTERQRLWDLLEVARRNAGVVQHHDAITGSMCDSNEGCTGAGYMAQVMGAHNVLEVYEDMVTTTASNANQVIAAVLGDESGLRLTPSISVFGETLMDQKQIKLVVYNSLGSVRTEMVSMQVPICNVGIVDSKGNAVASQVTSQATINDGIAPFYDFDLHFEATLAPLSYSTFTVTPLDSLRHCGGNLMSRALTSFSQHVPIWPTKPSERTASRLDSMMAGLIAEQQRMMALGEESAVPEAVGALTADGDGPVPPPQQHSNVPSHVQLENKFMTVYIDTSLGIQAIFHKASGTNYSLTHELYRYDDDVTPMAAYNFKPLGMASPVLNGSTVKMATVALHGPVMQEARFQIDGEHKTRVRLWISDDPAVGGRLEFGHKIGVLEQQTEILSRFTVKQLSTATFYSEDNGLQTVAHRSGCPNCTADPGEIAYRHYPSQMSAFLSDGTSELAIALEHSHAVASLINGTIDVVQHRRGVALTGVDGNLAMDDADRVFTQTWVSLGPVNSSNRLRQSNKLRLNHPLALMFEVGSKEHQAEVGRGSPQQQLHDRRQAGDGLPSQIHAQSVRATDPNASQILVNVMHVCDKGSEPASDSQPVSVDLAALLAPFRSLTSFEETTINGVTPTSTLHRLRWNTTAPSPNAPEHHAEDTQKEAQDGAAVLLPPGGLRAFLAAEA